MHDRGLDCLGSDGTGSWVIGSDGTGCWGGGSDGTPGRMGRRVGRVGRVGFLGYGDVDDPRPILSVTRGVQEYAARTSEEDADPPSDNIRILN